MFKKVVYLATCVFVLGLALTSTANAGIPGLIAHWRLDEASGTAIGDASGNGNNGTLEGGTRTQGKLDGGVYLDGVDDYIEVPNVITATGSLAFWFKPDWDGSDPEDYRLFDASLGGIYFFISKGADHADINPEDFGFYLEDATDADYQGIEIDPTGVIVADTWFHVTATWEFGGGPAILYINGEEVSRADNLGPLPALDPNPRFGFETFTYIPQANGATGVIDDIMFFDKALTAPEIPVIMQGLGAFPWAWGPDPKDGTMYSDTWITLGWSPGDFAVSHDVYLSDNYDEVDTGAENTFLGNQIATYTIAGFPGFAYPDGLIPGTTYYWRIDEVNDAEPNSPWKGPIWSFSIPPKTAYSPDPADGGEAVGVDGDLSWTPGFGSIIHYVYFGDNFDDVSNAAGNPPWGSTTYDPGTLEMAKTYYWRVDEFDAVGTHKGNVWSFTTEGAVTALNPANGAVDVSQTPVLTWAPGLGASHEIYFGAEAASLELKGSGNLGSESYEPGQLEWDTTYYWRVDEANNANANSPWTGPLWSFTTANFLIIDDMESYNDLDEGDPASNRIYLAWIDGFDNPAINGSVVGFANAPFAEQTIVHSGNQSMPMAYDNAVGKSEATLNLTSNTDWTVKGVNTLTIWNRGSAGNAAEQMYVVLNGSARVDHDNPDAASRISWTQWNIDLQTFADQGVNLANVNSITLGLSSVTGGAGMMYYDDIRLYPPAP
ncbi:MAG: LamG domain-containing protein [Planctomycetes bacterium]|nr:LamG domain-containing protein [Planctomycetota bacterium]